MKCTGSQNMFVTIIKMRDQKGGGAREREREEVGRERKWEGGCLDSDVTQCVFSV